MPSENVSFPAEKTFTFEGKLKIVLKCIETTERIVLNSDGLSINESSVKVFESDDKGIETLKETHISGLEYKVCNFS